MSLLQSNADSLALQLAEFVETSSNGGEVLGVDTKDGDVASSEATRLQDPRSDQRGSIPWSSDRSEGLGLACSTMR
jgi:hypothetical protein